LIFPAAGAPQGVASFKAGDHCIIAGLGAPPGNGGECLGTAPFYAAARKPKLAKTGQRKSFKELFGPFNTAGSAAPSFGKRENAK